jgi:FkbM family methyltransferase
MKYLPRPVRHFIRRPYRRIVRDYLYRSWTQVIFRSVFARWPSSEEKAALQDDEATVESRPAGTFHDYAYRSWYRAIFHMLFGRWPDDEEREVLQDDAFVQRAVNTPSTFRNILSLVDQKRNPTPFSVRLTADDVSVVDYGGVKIAVDRAEPVISRFIESGEYERYMVAFFQKVLRPGMTMIDIGANIGLFSLLAAKLVGETGHVYSVEASGENARLLLYSARLNGFKNIQLFPLAVGDVNGYTLYQSHIGANGALLTNPGKGAEFSSESILHPSCQVVPMARLDSLVTGPVDVIKLDIEGAEGLALRGGLNLIRTNRPLITSEASYEMLDRVSRITLHDYFLMIRSLGYRQFLIDRESGELEEVIDLGQFTAEWTDQLRIEDFVFVPEEKMEMLAMTTFKE